MRRTDKQISDPNIIRNILEQNNVCRIALSDNNLPYIIPMNYGYSRERIFLHSAKGGKKIDILEKNNSVCFEITDSIELIEAENACSFGTKYRSVIGYGTIFTIKDSENKKKALQIIMNQHSHKNDWVFLDNNVKNIIILELIIDSITGKSSGIYQ